MKKLTLIAAIVIGGLIGETVNAEAGARLRFDPGFHRHYVPAARVAYPAPVYRENAPVYDNDRRGYKVEDRYDNRDYRNREYGHIDRDHRYNEQLRNDRSHDNREAGRQHFDNNRMRSEHERAGK